jgi:hypothetical protein
MKRKAIIAATSLVVLIISTFSVFTSAVIIIRSTEIAMELAIDKPTKYAIISGIALFLLWMQSMIIDFVYLIYKHGFGIADKEQDEPKQY